MAQEVKIVSSRLNKLATIERACLTALIAAESIGESKLVKLMTAQRNWAVSEINSIVNK